MYLQLESIRSCSWSLFFWTETSEVSSSVGVWRSHLQVLFWHYCFLHLPHLFYVLLQPLVFCQLVLLLLDGEAESVTTALSWSLLITTMPSWLAVTSLSLLFHSPALVEVLPILTLGLACIVSTSVPVHHPACISHPPTRYTPPPPSTMCWIVLGASQHSLHLGSCVC